MNFRSCRWLVWALLISASGAWAQQSAPLASDQTLTTAQVSGTPKAAQCSAPPALDQKSITAFRQRADNGDAAAKCGLGLMYAQGKGVPQDYAQAAAWWRKAAEQGIYLTQSMLGHLYQKGQGVPQDYAQAALWYRKAAGLGDVDARGKLGAFYMMGQGVPQDYAEAYFWSDLAAAGKQEAPQAEAVTTIRDEAASHLTPADLSRVQERARKWFEAHQAKPQ